MSVTFYNLTTATEEFIGFTNLQSVTFSGTHSAGLDDIAVTTSVPEPYTLFLAGRRCCLVSRSDPAGNQALNRSDSASRLGAITNPDRVRRGTQSGEAAVHVGTHPQ